MTFSNRKKLEAVHQMVGKKMGINWIRTNEELRKRTGVVYLKEILSDVDGPCS